jgi:hypothetical protein
MRRYVAFVLLAATATLAATASAGLTIWDNQYEGRVEGDPQTYAGFDVKPTDAGRKVTRIYTHAPASCYSGNGGYADIFGLESLKVDGEGRFGGKIDADFEGSHFKLKFAGKLLAGGKARGTLSARGVFTGGGKPTPIRARGESTTCYTGILRWRAKRGAEITYAD